MSEVRRVGDAWWYLYPEHAVAIIIDHVREKSDGLSAEITVKALTPAGQLNGHIYWARLSLGAPRSRTEIASALVAKDGETPWRDMLERCIARTAMEFRESLDLIDLAAVDIGTGERAYLIERVLPYQEISMFYADGASGKSLLMMLFAIACRTGLELPSRLKPTQICPVWYLDFETNARAHARRCAWLCHGLGVPRPQFAYSRVRRPIRDLLDEIRRHMAATRYGLLIVDSVGFAAGGDINEQQVATELLTALGSLSTTVALVHHVSKEAAEYSKGPVKPFGSGYFYHGTRNAWEIRAAHPTEDQLNLALYHRKDNDDIKQQQPIGLSFVFDKAAQTISVRPHDVGADLELAQHAGLAFEIRQLLRSGGMTVKAICDETGRDQKSVYVTLRRMPDAIQLNEGARGRGNAATWGLGLGA